MGHTNSKIFFKHYRRPMKQAMAVAYWQIFPDSAAGGKVVNFSATA